MGDRANYVVIEGGRSEIYFSRWGAPYIPAVLLAGPEATVAYVRALTPDNDLLDCVWAEGGISLDIDQRELRFFGGVKVASAPYVRRLLLNVLRAIWPGWSVDWARFGIADLALSLGWDVGRVLDTQYDDPNLLNGASPVIHDSAIQATHELKRARCLFSVRWPDGVVRDYLVTPQMTSVLSVGPRLLELMAHMPAVTLPNEADPDLPLEGVYLDTTSNAVWMSAGELDPRQMTAVARRWPGWHIEGHTEGLYRQVMLSGRDLSVVAVSAERAIHELVEELASGQTIDPSAIYSALTRSEESPLQAAEGVRFGVGFFSADSPPLSAEERREVILRVLREKSAGTDSDSQTE